MRKQLKRDQMAVFFANLSPCLIGMEACSSAHYWARKLEALGHTVRLMAPQFVRVPLGEVMAMTEHRSVSTVMGYFQAGALLESRATTLLNSSTVDDQEPPKDEHIGATVATQQP